MLFNTVHKPWSDVIPCTYEMKHTLKELIRVKAFLLAGTTVSIVEEKVSRPRGSGILFPPCPPPASLSPFQKGQDGCWGVGSSSGSAAWLRVGSSHCLDPLLACGTNAR